jgi:hypothetical protein
MAAFGHAMPLAAATGTDTATTSAAAHIQRRLFLCCFTWVREEREKRVEMLTDLANARCRALLLTAGAPVL